MVTHDAPPRCGGNRRHEAVDVDELVEQLIEPAGVERDAPISVAVVEHSDVLRHRTISLFEQELDVEIVGLEGSPEAIPTNDVLVRHEVRREGGNRGRIEGVDRERREVAVSPDAVGPDAAQVVLSLIKPGLSEGAGLQGV
ncbi:MAG: hypothetical protein M3Q48_11635 [Actinomycetota bacterium]|nr:hypothetical protein [Actinomycetota bacterium]